MKTFTTPKAMVAAVLCYAAIITFSSFLVETVYAHSSSSGSAGSSNNHEHGRIVSVSELLLTVTPYTAGLAIGFTFLFWKRKWKEVLEGIRTQALRFTKPFHTWPR
ncbi:MAG TPA: hypothetical protein VFZ67_04550 [Nitrososphaera sp.]